MYCYNSVKILQDHFLGKFAICSLHYYLILILITKHQVRHSSIWCFFASRAFPRQGMLKIWKKCNTKKIGTNVSVKCETGKCEIKHIKINLMQHRRLQKCETK